MSPPGVRTGSSPSPEGESVFALFSPHMAYIEDLAPCYYVQSAPNRTDKIKAVGWLGRGHAFNVRKTELSEMHFRKLLQLLQHPWQPGCFLGWHDCEFCEAKDWKAPLRTGLFSSLRNLFKPPARRVGYPWDRLVLERYGMVIRFGIANLYLPGKDCIYVAPSMIAHYIDEHHYDPPAQFWQAVMDCPEMGTPAYKQALLANGPSGGRWMHQCPIARTETSLRCTTATCVDSTPRKG